jgi:hypothetical protein
MRKVFFAAVSTLIASGFAFAEPAVQGPPRGHFEISIKDLPPGSSKDLGAAMREYSRSIARGDQPKPGLSQRAMNPSDEVVSFPKEHVYEVDDARLNWGLEKKPSLADYAGLEIKPVDLEVTASCELVTTQPNGVYNRRDNVHSGFSRHYKCPLGDVYLRDMSFFGFRKITIKEQNNITIGSVQGRMSGFRDKVGNSYTMLSWVSNEVDHLVQMSGTNEETRQWLIRYAEELVSKEGK